MKDNYNRDRYAFAGGVLAPVEMVESELQWRVFRTGLHGREDARIASI
jgi:hypothetical protein